MKLFEGKSPEERNKLIAAMVLGVLALVALTYTFGGMFFGGTKANVAVSASPTPTATTSPRPNSDVATTMPSASEMDTVYMTTPINYVPDSFYAPDAGRNIFAFYEPPIPTPYVTPIITPTPFVEPPTPTPTPVPPILVGFVSPQSVYAGSKTFRLEVNGDKFTPESKIYLNNSLQLPTTFISPQKLVADMPSNLIAGAGEIFVIVRTPDGALYSNQVSLKVEAPPTPQFQYIGMIARQRFNNDTAYFLEPSKQTPVGKRLNDVLGGRFRLISISSEETVFEDVNLGFKHRLALLRPQPGQSSSVNPAQNQNPSLNNPGRLQQPQTKGNYNPNFPQQNYPQPQPQPVQPGEIPGIPGNVQIYTVPQPPPPGTPAKTNTDDDDDGNN